MAEKTCRLTFAYVDKPKEINWPDYVYKLGIYSERPLSRHPNMTDEEFALKVKEKQERKEKCVQRHLLACEYDPVVESWSDFFEEQFQVDNRYNKTYHNYEYINVNTYSSTNTSVKNTSIFSKIYNYIFGKK